MAPAAEAPPSPTPLAAAPGMLHVVATPLGHRGDLSPRARAVLLTADIVAAEDTRSVGRLLGADDRPRGRLVAVHEHNERDTAAAVADAVAAGQSVALVSEAGTPAVSDPGFRAVRECRRRGLPVTPVPGPCAAVAALSASGLPSDAFLFLGFPPPRSAPRRALLEQWRDFPHTLAFYESPHRVEAFLTEIAELLGPERVICLARELTKLHETILTGPAEEVARRLAAGSKKGEFTILVARAGYVL